MTKVSSSGDKLLRKPATGIGGCCARAASGHVAAAPPRRVMKARRCMSTLKRWSPHFIGTNEYFDKG
jgi:hypothetical protein